MFANYHTHTWRCHHAEGTERQYVELAIEAGIRILGFSDHAPVPFPDGYESGIRMLPGQLGDYVDTILDLKREYSRDIEIHVGLEAEYYPDLFEAQLGLWRPYPIEYVLLGQHFLGNENHAPYAGQATDDARVLTAYCRQAAEGLETGAYCCFAHPDLINFTGDGALYEREMRALCQKAKALGIPLEVNLLGIMINRHYPNPAFWRIAGEVGNDVVLGADIHRPGNVYCPDACGAAMHLVREYGLHLLETLPLRPPLRRLP